MERGWSKEATQGLDEESVGLCLLTRDPLKELLLSLVSKSGAAVLSRMALAETVVTLLLPVTAGLQVPFSLAVMTELHRSGRGGLW